MKRFNDIEDNINRFEEPPVVDRYSLQKQRLLMNLTRSDEVISAVAEWLNSFLGGMSKDVFTSQMNRLSFNDSEAIEQLKSSKGKRSISKMKKPPLPPITDVIQLLANDILFIAVNGREKAIQSFIRNTYQELKTLGNTFVLDVDEIKLLWTEKYNQGKSKELLQKARDAEFLIIVGFEAPQSFPSFINEELNTIRRYRIRKGLPMIMPFARSMENSIFIENFRKFSVV